ncbi:MAG: MFS transporter [Thermoanaerobaculia bacterium]
MNVEPYTPSRPERLREVLVPSFFLLITMLNLTLIVAGLKELIIDELGGTERDASLFFSIEMAAYVVFAPLWGLLSDRLGRRKPLIVIGFFVSALLYASYSAVTSVGLLLVLRFVQGAFTVMGWSTLMAMVLDRADGQRRGRHLGLMGASLILGVSIGAPLGGYMSRSWGAHAPLQAAAVLFLGLAIGSLAMSEGRRHAHQISTREILAALRSRPRLLLPALFYFVDRYTVGFIVVLFPLYLASLGVEDPAVRGQYLGAFLLPFAFLQYFTGRLTERIGTIVPLVGGSLLYGIALCAVGYSGLGTLWWVMAGLGVLASVMFPPAIVMTAELSDPATRGSAMGGFNLAGSVGFAIGPVVGVWAYQTWGYGFAFVLAGVLEILVAVVAIGLLWRWKTIPGR